MNGRLRWVHGLFAALNIFMLVVTVHAIPPAITLSGYLTDADDDPISGEFAAQVLFFQTESSYQPIHSIDLTIAVNNGALDSKIAPPDSILLLDEIWYALAVDINGDGITASDYFADRYQVTSVPFALSGKPVTFFDTHGGTRAGGGSWWGDGLPSTIVISPFTTPPGGVRFNRMSGRVEPHDDTVKVMFGIYDAQGNLVYSSPPATRQSDIELFIFELEGALKPSTMYYSAFWTSDWSKIYLPDCTNIPTVPNTGILRTGGDSKGLKAQVDVGGIRTEPRLSLAPVSIGLYLVDETSPANMRQFQSKGIDHTAPKAKDADDGWRIDE